MCDNFMHDFVDKAYKYMEKQQTELEILKNIVNHRELRIKVLKCDDVECKNFSWKTKEIDGHYIKGHSETSIVQCYSCGVMYCKKHRPDDFQDVFINCWAKGLCGTCALLF